MSSTAHACSTSLLARDRTPTTAELLRAAYSAGSARAQGQMAAAHELSAVANGAAQHGHAMSPSGVPLRHPPACTLESVTCSYNPPREVSYPLQMQFVLLEVAVKAKRAGEFRANAPRQALRPALCRRLGAARDL